MPSLRPIHILNLAVTGLLLLIAIVLAALERLPDVSLVLTRQTLMLIAVLVMVFVDRRLGRTRVGDILASFYPILLVPAVFSGLQPLISAVGAPNRDRELILIDRALFGTDATVFLARFITPWLNDLMHLAYCTYYVIPLVVGVSMWRTSPALARRFIFVCSLAFYLSYIGYFIIPARGPRFAQWPADANETRNTLISKTIYDTINGLEKTKDDVFPSGHVMITSLCLMAAYGFRRRLFRVLLPFAVALGASTVYCRFHYFIDVLAGFVLACVTLPLANWIYYRSILVRGGPAGPIGASTADAMASRR